MSTPFQNRIVGTIIVAAVAIIFLPDIFDGEKERYQEVFEEIPVAPETNFTANKSKLDSQEFVELKQDSIVDEVALDDEQGGVSNANSTENGEGVNQTPPKAKTAKDDKSAELKEDKVVKVNPVTPPKAKADTAWVIQLGSFRHKNNVAQLVEKLRKAGYTVFTHPIKTKSGTLTKVFVGPELNKSSLEKKIPALKELTKVQGKVARYQPTK